MGIMSTVSRFAGAGSRRGTAAGGRRGTAGLGGTRPTGTTPTGAAGAAGGRNAMAGGLLRKVLRKR